MANHDSTIRWPLMQTGRRGGPVISSPTPPAQAGNPAGTVVFEAVLDHFFLKLRDQRSADVNRIRVWLIEQIGSHRESIGVDGHSAMCIVRWLNGTAESIGMSIDTLVLRRLLHSAYVVACEYYGPVLSDAALAEAARIAEARPEAKQFEPRLLL